MALRLKAVTLNSGSGCNNLSRMAPAVTESTKQPKTLVILSRADIRESMLLLFDITSSARAGSVETGGDVRTRF